MKVTFKSAAIGAAIAAVLLLGAGCGSGPQIRQTRMRVTEVEIRAVPSGTLFESVEIRPRSRDQVEPLSLGSRSRISSSSTVKRETRVLRGETKVRVLYRGSYRALVMMRGGERGYVPVYSLQEQLPASAFDVGSQPKIAGRKYRDRPSEPILELGFDADMDVFVDEALIEEVNRAMPMPE